MATDRLQNQENNQQINTKSRISKKKIAIILVSLILVYCAYQNISQKLFSPNSTLQHQQQAKGRSMMIEVPQSPSQKQIFINQNSANFSSSIQRGFNQSTKLKDFLSWNIDPLYKILDFNSINQTQKSIQMPIMISLNSSDIFQNSLINNNNYSNMKEWAHKYHWTLKYLPNRPNIDLICVIDVSSSMLEHGKIDNVIQTLKFMLNFLREDDRLSLITFNHESQILLPLTKFQNNSEHLTNLIESLQAYGNTNIFAGMENAFKTIKMASDQQEQNSQSTFTNRVSSILLLSDGQDNTNFNNLKEKIQESYNQIFNVGSSKKQTQSFSINSFGYGRDHDSHQLSSVAELKNGNFFYVSESGSLKKYFLSVFGSLATTLCTDIEIQVKLKNQNLTILKTYGEQWEKILDSKNQFYYQLKLPSIEYGKQYNYVFDLLIPTQLSQFQQKPSQQQFFGKDLQVKFQCIPTRSLIITDEQIFEEIKYLNISIGDFNQQVRSWDYKVQKNLLRMKAVEVIDLARNASEKNNFEEAKLFIKNITKQFEKFEIEVSSKKIELNKDDQKELEALKNDLKQILENCGKEKFFQEGGQHEFQAKAKKYRSMSYHPDNNQVYQNQIQLYYDEL